MGQSIILIALFHSMLKEKEEIATGRNKMCMVRMVHESIHNSCHYRLPVFLLEGVL